MGRGKYFMRWLCHDCMLIFELKWKKKSIDPSSWIRNFFTDMIPTNTRISLKVERTFLKTVAAILEPHHTNFNQDGQSKKIREKACAFVSFWILTKICPIIMGFRFNPSRRYSTMEMGQNMKIFSFFNWRNDWKLHWFFSSQPVNLLSTKRDRNDWHE